MRPPKLGTLFALAACLILVVPAFAAPNRWEGWKPYERHYLGTYEQCWEAFEADCGRNLLDYAWKGGEPVPRAKVEAGSETMERWLNPPEPVASDSPVVVAPAPVTSSVPTTSAGGCPASMAPESGSDGYSAYNASSGAYGCYQVIPSTAAAHGCDLSTPDGQDACAQTICATEGPGAWSASGANPC